MEKISKEFRSNLDYLGYAESKLVSPRTISNLFLILSQCFFFFCILKKPYCHCDYVGDCDTFVLKNRKSLKLNL